MDLTRILSNPTPTADELLEAERYLAQLARETIAEIDRIDNQMFSECLDPPKEDFFVGIERIAGLRRQNEQQRRRLADIHHMALSLQAKRHQL